jgi:hypothetical protein
LNSAGQQIACNDSGQFQLVVQSSTNTAWGSYDYGTTFISQVITLNNTGTAFTIAGTWWNLSMSADGRYAITAGGNSGTPIALKLQVKDSIAKNVIVTGTSTNTGLITANGGIVAKNLTTSINNNNIRPFATNPIIAENIPKYVIATTTSLTFNNQSVFFVSIYLTAGTVITGVQSYIGATVLQTNPLCQGAIWNSTGTLLANSNGVAVAAANLRIIFPFTATYTIPTSGIYLIGVRGDGGTSTYAIASTGILTTNIYNDVAGTQDITLISAGLATLATMGNLPATGGAQFRIPYIAVY